MIRGRTTQAPAMEGPSLGRGCCATGRARDRLTAIERAINRGFDRFVHPLHTRCRARGIVPHAAVWGLALMILPIVATVASLATGIRPWAAPLAILAALLGYLLVYMPVKQHAFPAARRKLLIDLVAFVAPTFFGLTWFMGVPPSEVTLVFVVIVLSGVGVLRMGCFFGGCCHGEASRIGVKYPGAGVRVVPLPLLEATVGVLLLGLVVAFAGTGVPAPRLALAAALGYTGYRFAAEFFRARHGAFAVRRYLSLSLTQWLCLVLLGAGAALLVSGVAS